MAELFELSRHGDFDHGDYAFEVSSPDGSAVGKALAENGPFPEPPVDLLSLKLQGRAQQEALPFGTGNQRVEVRLGVGGRVLVRGTAGELRQALEIPDTEPFVEALDGSPPVGSRFLLLERDYVLGAEASGAVALASSAARFRFGLDGVVEGRLRVVRAFDPEDASREVLHSAVQSWRSPRTIGMPGSDSELPPRTWVLVESAGSIELEADAGYGLDFTWVRESPIGTLEGDVGLDLNARIKAAIQLRASGQFSVRVSRPDSRPILRVQVNRIKKRGWGFSFDTRVGISPQVPPLPENPQELLRAILGTHPRQLLVELEALRNWSTGDEDTVELLSGFTVGEARSLLEGVFGADFEARVEEARDRVLSLLDRIRSADERAVAFLVNEIEERTDGAEEKVEAFLEPLREGLETLQDPARAREYLEGNLGRVAFLSSPVGEWLLAVVGDRLASALVDEELGGIVEQAERTLAIIRVPTLAEIPLLPELLAEVRKPFRKLDELADTAQHTLSFDMDSLSVWARSKVEALVRDTGVDDTLEEVRKGIRKFFSSSDALYSVARDALARDYELRFARSVQESRSRDALLDVTFNFDEGDPEKLHEIFRKVLRGSFGGVLLTEHPGIRLNRSALTVGFSRRGHVQIALPFYQEEKTRAIDVISSFSAAREVDGTVYVLKSEAEGTVTSTSRHSSSLSLSVSVDLGGRVRQFKPERFDIRWATRHALNDLHEKELVQILRPWSLTLLPGVFGGGERGSLEDWVSDLDNLVDLAEPSNGARHFGDTLLELSASVPASVCAAWFDAPAKARDPIYQWLGHQLQASVKSLFSTFFFADPRRYTRNQEISSAFLVFQSAPSHLNRDNEHWFTSNPVLDDPNHPVMASSALRTRLERTLHEVHDIVGQLPRHAHRARHFHPGKVTSVLEDAKGQLGRAQLRRLFRLEKIVVNGARSAGLELGKARRRIARASGPMQREKAVARALERLQSFELTVVRAFNQELEVPFARGMARPLGAILFTEAARVFGADEKPPRAVLNLTVVRNDGGFRLGAYLAGELPGDEDVVVRQLLTSPRS